MANGKKDLVLFVASETDPESLKAYGLVKGIMGDHKWKWSIFPPGLQEGVRLPYLSTEECSIYEGFEAIAFYMRRRCVQLHVAETAEDGGLTLPVRMRIITLYVDALAESREAVKLLGAAGVPLDVVWCKKGQEQVLPTAICSGFVSPFRGIIKIRKLKDILDEEVANPKGIHDGLKVYDPRYPGFAGVRYGLEQPAASSGETCSS